MICQQCQAPDVSAKDNGVVVCWCGADLCKGCVDPHTAGCEWYQKQATKPEKRVKKRREKRR
ncbi:MAG: hypothetical protein JFAIHJKO_02792 [Pyrinomonadaceae bacterium]|nr:hypothetical protein [Pyrinomonadaceae bacterium]